MIRTLLVDKDGPDRDRLRVILERQGDLAVAGEAESLFAARHLLTSQAADAIFLGSHLPDGSGFDLIPHIPEAAELVILSDRRDLAVEAFEVGALDYLLTPLSRRRLERTLARLRYRRTTSPADERKIPVPDGRGLHLVPPADIVAITALGGNYSAVHLENNSRLVVRRSLTAWEERLPSADFVRVHRAGIINLRHLEQTHHHDGRLMTVRLRGLPLELPVSRRLRPRLENLLTVRGQRDREEPRSLVGG